MAPISAILTNFDTCSNMNAPICSIHFGGFLIALPEFYHPTANISPQHSWSKKLSAPWVENHHRHYPAAEWHGAIAGRTPTTAGPLRAWNGNGKVEKREMKFNHFLFLNPAREVWWGGRCSFSRCLELTVKMEYLLFAPFFLCKKSV